MADFLAYDAAYTAKQIEAMLIAYPELADDEELRADMLDGETDLTRIMSRLVRSRQEKLAAASGLASYIGDLSERKARMERGAQGIKTLMVWLMNAAELPKLVLDEATISVTKPRTKVVVTDVEALPQGTFTTERVPNKEAIKAQLEAGQSIPGATLETGDPSITIRTK